MKRKSLPYLTATFGVVFLGYGLIFFSSTVSDSIQKTLLLLGKSVIPSLFPFFVMSRLFTSLQISDFFSVFFKKIMTPLFSVSPALASALALGLCGGYPIGASTVTEIYRAELCSKEEAERALAFCNNSGPAFIIGVCGSVFSVSTGVFLFFVHSLSAICTGIILRLFVPLKASQKTKNGRQPIPEFSVAFTDSVLSALNSILSISAYIVFFSALVAILRQSHILSFITKPVLKITGLSTHISEAFFTGLTEMTSGIFELSGFQNESFAIVLTSLLLGWGGFSVHAQTLNCLANTDLATKEYFLGKLVHAIVSAIFSLIFLPAFS
ncbi:MAG: hypothetical protein IKU65_01090 [Oscillospiraceae bacterium]|nr:hypothetical protein [Oscillospiraceae bacterium]